MSGERTGIGRAADPTPLTFRGLLAAIGGPLGVVEGVLPGLVFVVAYQVLALRAAPGAVPRDALPFLVVPPLVLSALFVVLRLVRRQRATAALGGAGGATLSAALVLLTGSATTNFLPGILTNAGYAAALLVSVAVRRPLIGLVAAFALNDRTGWRRPPRLRVYGWLTVLWSALFAVRLAVQIPLYLAQDTVALGIWKIVLGLPLYAPLLVLTILVVQAMQRRDAADPA